MPYRSAAPSAAPLHELQKRLLLLVLGRHHGLTAHGAVCVEGREERVLQASVLGGLREVAVHLSEESAAMNSSTMCILACIVAVLAVNGPGGAWGRAGELAASASKLPPHSICMPSSMRNHVQTMNLRFRTAFLMTGAIPFETEIQTSSTTHMSAAFAGSPRCNGEFSKRKSIFRSFEPVNGTNQSTLAYHGCAAAC